MAGERGGDRLIQQRVAFQLTTRGIRNPCRVDAAVKEGDVTLTGTIQYEHQRKAATQAASGVSGVRRVNDRMLVKPVVKH
ncbi:MAG: BON domain-containing protein [Planctomycetia bacterium]|nr:BON domain-containing protein [Planctomycetia bacterium]